MTETAGPEARFQFRLGDLFALLTACAVALALARYRSYFGLGLFSLALAVAVSFRRVPFREVLAAMFCGISLIGFGETIILGSIADHSTWDPFEGLWNAATIGMLLKALGILIVLAGTILLGQTILIQAVRRHGAPKE